MRKLRHLLYLILLIAIDQVTKNLVLTKLKGQDPFQVIPNVLQFYYHENTGAVWGIMSGKVSILIIVSVIILAGMIALYFKIPNEKHYNYLRIIMIFITAGAIGNLIDRSIHKYVVDFIYFKLIDFPIFNVADTYVTVSSILLILLSLFYYKDEDFDFLSRNSSKKAANSDDNEEKNISVTEDVKEDVYEDGIENENEDGNENVYEADSKKVSSKEVNSKEVDKKINIEVNKEVSQDE
jgi:signal peptidase II